MALTETEAAELARGLLIIERARARDREDPAMALVKVRAMLIAAFGDDAIAAAAAKQDGTPDAADYS